MIKFSGSGDVTKVAKDEEGSAPPSLVTQYHYRRNIEDVMYSLPLFTIKMSVEKNSIETKIEPQL